jgi:hypothetical protein
MREENRLDDRLIELVYNIFSRPRMYSDARDLRELLLFVDGVVAGQRHLGHGTPLADFWEYVNVRFGRHQFDDSTAILIEQFQGTPYLDSCGAIAGLVDDWKSQRADPA